MTTRTAYLRILLAIGVLAVGANTSVHAEVYEFRFLSGGGGGSIPERQRIVRGAGTFICLDVKQSSLPPANRVLFTIWSEIPHPESRIRRILFDTGRHTQLFSDVTVATHSPNTKMFMVPAKPYASLPRITPEYQIDSVQHYTGGLAPGQFVVAAATLQSGRTYADVIAALNEGISQSNRKIANPGLTVGVIALDIIGLPPPGVGTIHGDGGFIISAVSSRCRRR